MGVANRPTRPLSNGDALQCISSVYDCYPRHCDYNDVTLSFVNDAALTNNNSTHPSYCLSLFSH